MDNKPWYEKIYIWIGIVAGVFAILGISIFGGKSLLENKDANDSTANFEGNDINTGNQSPVINGDGDITINYGNANQDSDLSFKSNSLPSSETNTEEEYHQGTITKTGWESKFIGLRYTNPEGMTMSTEEEIDEINELEGGISSIILDPNELGQIRITTVLEMVGNVDDQSASVWVCVERLLDEEELDVRQFIESYESQIARIFFVDYRLISDDKTVKIGNEDYTLVSYMIGYNNDFKYMDNYVRIVGDRAIMITIIYGKERVRDNILDAFTAY